MIWNDSLSTGIEQIDSQHKELISRINDFLNACMNQRSREVIGSTLGFVEDYIVRHFADEQSLHISSGYPKAAVHKLAHDNFVRNFEGLKKKMDKESLSLTVMLETNTLLVDWLIQHINGVDKEFAAYYRTIKA